MFSQYAGHVLIFAGFLLFSTLLRSAAGPAELIPRQSIVAPPTRAGATAGTASGALLIANPRRPGDVAASPAPVSSPTAEPSPTAAPPPEASAPEPVAEPEPEPALSPTDRLTIGRIALSTKVIDVGVAASGEMETAAFAVGRLSSTVQAGEAGNVVLAGHDDIQGEVFRRLPELQVGDDVILYRGPTQYTYRVELRTIVREDGVTAQQKRENARWMDPTDDAVATLISCYPYRVDTHRIIVRARLVSST